MKFYLTLSFIIALAMHASACSGSNNSSSPQAAPTPPITIKTTTDGYPDIWWQPVPQADLKSWEIGPQAADRSKGEVVLSKRNELGQFSNLAATPFIMDGISYGSVEGLWQGMKFPESAHDERFKDHNIKWPFTREQVYAMSDFEAKDAGDIASANMKKLGIKWVTYKGEKIDYKGKDAQRHYEIILEASRNKVAQNPNVQKLLLSTGDLIFLPDHKQGPNDPPAYKYFDIYMLIRSELQNP